MYAVPFTNRLSVFFQILVSKKLEAPDTSLHIEAIFLLLLHGTACMEHICRSTYVCMTKASVVVDLFPVPERSLF